MRLAHPHMKVTLISATEFVDMSASTDLQPSDHAGQNPLLADWSTPFGIPPFDRVAPDHYGPAFTAAFAEHRAEIAAIAENPAPADFANTIAALERSGRALRRVASVFFNLAHSHTNDAIGRGRARNLAALRPA